MDLEDLRRHLITAARGQTISDSVPYAFEKRIMAALRRPAVADPWTAWNHVLWRAAAPCLAIMCAMTIWAILTGDLAGGKNSLATELDRTVMAPLANWDETW